MDITRRKLMVQAAGISALGAAMPLAFAQSASADGGASLTDSLTCFIGGQPVSREQVLKWELGRMLFVWKKLRPFATRPIASRLNTITSSASVSPADMSRMRQDLLDLKLQLGSKRIKEILENQLALAAASEKLLVASSFGRYALSVTEVQCNRGSAQGFVDWFAGRVLANDEPAMLVACPDHYVLETQANGQQYVLETTGGSPLPTQFDIDYSNDSGNPVILVPDLPVRVGGMALRSGRTIGYAYHQFGALDGGGFHGRLAVAFPSLTPKFMINGHQWHLACEFSNWIEGYVRSLG